MCFTACMHLRVGQLGGMGRSRFRDQRALKIWQEPGSSLNNTFQSEYILKPNKNCKYVFMKTRQGICRKAKHLVSRPIDYSMSGRSRQAKSPLVIYYVDIYTACFFTFSVLLIWQHSGDHSRVVHVGCVRSYESSAWPFAE